MSSCVSSKHPQAKCMQPFDKLTEYKLVYTIIYVDNIYKIELIKQFLISQVILVFLVLLKYAALCFTIYSSESLTLRVR